MTNNTAAKSATPLHGTYISGEKVSGHTLKAYKIFDYCFFFFKYTVWRARVRIYFRPYVK